jgi:hypothetical protein
MADALRLRLRLLRVTALSRLLCCCSSTADNARTKPQHCCLLANAQAHMHTHTPVCTQPSSAPRTPPPPSPSTRDTLTDRQGEVEVEQLARLCSCWQRHDHVGNWDQFMHAAPSRAAASSTTQL